MEVVVPVQDFHFDSTTTTPYVSAPSSPKRFGNPLDYYYHYNSAPTSPTRAAAIYAHLSNPSPTTSPVAPFDWEQKPDDAADEDDDFEFDFSGQMEKGAPPAALTAADELFEKGRIRPLKLPPRLHHPTQDEYSSVASSPRSPRQKALWSPRRRGGGGGGGGEGFDPFTAAMVEVTRDRGRERLSSSTSRKGSRSLSPLRGGVGVFHKSPNSPPHRSTATTSSSAAAAAGSTTAKSGGSKKWRLRDLLLFRSASEGRATGNRSKDPLRKYSMLPSSSSSSPTSSLTNKRVEDSMSSSFRSMDSNESTRRGSKPAVSAHEAHYTANRAASEELKKKIPLPYRQGLLGCLRFNPAVNNIAKGFNSYTFNRSRT